MTKDRYVIGVDLGTSAVKALLVDQEGKVRGEVSKSYPLLHEKSGYSEQVPEHWVEQTVEALRELAQSLGSGAERIEGISFSGQMHGLVMLDREGRVLRNAILWNDSRTTEQCRHIERMLGERLLEVTRNRALEGFTLPKLLWVRQHEPEIYAQADVFLLPKDYLRYRLTGELHMDYSDAAGTLLLDVRGKAWSADVCEACGIDPRICPPLAESAALVGTLLPDIAERTGLSPAVKVFAGGADNACGAIGAGVLSLGVAMCSIGTSGVVLAYEEEKDRDFAGKLHFFNHGEREAFYVMGVTLAAGYSLEWWRSVCGGAGESFDELLSGVGNVPIGSNGLLFTPYLVGERTPHADGVIRASFIGLDGSHGRDDMSRAVMEGITFSLNESVQMLRERGKSLHSIVSIGGGAKNDVWLQMQADVFNATIVTLENEQGPGLGAAMLAAVGCGWFANLAECAAAFVKQGRRFEPNAAAAEQYSRLFDVYRQVYAATKTLNERLAPFRL